MVSLIKGSGAEQSAQNEMAPLSSQKYSNQDWVRH